MTKIETAEWISGYKLSDLWSDPMYINLIKGCAKAYKDCSELAQHLNHSFNKLTLKQQEMFADIVTNTWERVNFGLGI